MSTDNKRIKKIAEKYGAEVPFLRPKKLSNDFAITRDVIKHTMNFLNKKNKVDDFCCIYPTAPLLQKKALVKAFNIYNKNKKKKICFFSS